MTIINMWRFLDCDMSNKRTGSLTTQPSDVIKACVKKKSVHIPSAVERLCMCWSCDRVSAKNIIGPKNNYLFRSIRGTTFQLVETIACPRKIIKVRGCWLYGWFLFCCGDAMREWKLYTIPLQPSGTITHDHNSKCPTPTFATEH